MQIDDCQDENSITVHERNIKGTIKVFS